MLRWTPQNYIRARFAAALCVATALIAAPEPASAWQTAHGDPDNSGAVDVRTVRAINPIATVVVGDVELGAGPVIAPTVSLVPFRRERTRESSLCATALYVRLQRYWIAASC